MIALSSEFMGGVMAEVPEERSVSTSVSFEDGRPALGAAVNGWFRDGYIKQSLPKVLEANGRVTFTGRSDGNFGVMANMEGFYESLLGVQTQGAPPPLVRDGTYIFSLMLRKVQNPVPMYAIANHRVNFPAREVVGFDLLECKLTPPYGKGKVADFRLETAFEGSPAEGGSATLKLRFANEGDGIIVVRERAPGGSRLWLPHEAPEAGYLPEMSWAHKWPSPKSTPEEMLADAVARRAAPHPDAGYMFRIRTTLGKTGEVKNAMYGKMHGVPDWGTHPDSNESFFEATYYVNPSGTRSLEWKRGMNLFKNIEINEVPFLP